MHKTLKVLAWATAILLGLPVAVYLGWLTGNLSDDELSPAVTRVLAARPPQLDQQENAYFAILGIDAPDGQDAHAWGVERFKRLVATDDAPPGSHAHPAQAPAGKPLPKAADVPCHKAEKCLADVAADPDSAKRILRENDFLLRRLDAVRGAKYQEPYRKMSYWSDFAPSGAFPLVRALANTRVALLASQGRHAEALQQWGMTTEFLSRQLEGSCNLLQKMTAISALHRQHELLARYFERHPDAIKANAKTIGPFLRPLRKSELTQAPALGGEMAMIANSFVPDLAQMRRLAGPDMPGIPGAVFDHLFGPFLLPKATLNEAVERLMKWERLEALEGEAYRQSRVTLAAEEERISRDAGIWHYRNPIGRAVMAGTTYDYSTYLYRRDSLAAERRLLAFGLAMITEGVRNPSVIKEAASRRPELVHAYTGKSPLWNDEKRVLSHAVADGMTNESARTPIQLRIPMK